MNIKTIAYRNPPTGTKLSRAMKELYRGAAIYLKQEAARPDPWLGRPRPPARYRPPKR